MPSRWHYRIGLQETGPLDLADLQQLVHASVLSSETEVRAEGSDEWVSARTVPDLFLSPANADDLDSMLAAGATGAPADDETDRDGCYCRLRNEILGPMSFEQLAGLARMGRIAADDQVRLSSHGAWADARSIAGLFSETRIAEFAAEDATAEAAAILDALEVTGDPTPRKPRVRQTGHIPAIQMLDDEGLGDPGVAAPGATETGTRQGLTGRATTGVADAADQWHCRVLGQELGPISWADLRALVESRQLGPGDRVRRATNANWVPAGMIDGLFTAEQAAGAQPVSTSHLAPQRGFAAPGATPKATRVKRTEIGGRFWQPFKKAGAPTETDAGRLSPAAPAAGAASIRAADIAAASAAPSGPSTNIPATAPNRAAATTPPAASPSPPAAPAAPPPRPAPARPAVQVALPRARREFRNPFRGMGSAIGGGVGGLFGSLGSGVGRMFGSLGSAGASLGSMGSSGAGSLASQWKTLAAVAAVLAVAAALYAFPPFTGINKSATIYADTLRIWDTAQGLKEKSRPDEWRAFTSVSLPQSTALSYELQSMPTRDPMLDLMLKCHRDCLPKILKGRVGENPDAWNQMQQYMSEAKKLAAG